MRRLLPLELGVEDDVRRRKVELLEEAKRLRGAMFAVHPAVFPFDGERAGVADVVQSPNDRREVDVPVTEALEVPRPNVLVELGVAAEHARVRTVAPRDIFHVNVEDPAGELPNEPNVVDPLVAEMARIVV